MDTKNVSVNDSSKKLKIDNNRPVKAKKAPEPNLAFSNVDTFFKRKQHKNASRSFKPT